jgi:hypothetical protein
LSLSGLDLAIQTMVGFGHTEKQTIYFDISLTPAKGGALGD